MNLKDLDFETHKRHYENVFGVDLDDGPQNGARAHLAQFARAQALEAHAIAVHDPLRDVFFSNVEFARRLQKQDAFYYMLHGSGRRLSMIFYSYNKIIWNAPVTRSRPLSREEQSELNAALNTIYMHLLGILDNWTLTLLYENEPESDSKVETSRNISFFKNARQPGYLQNSPS